MSKTVHFVSLGCPKNRVDSEVMLGVALGDGYRHVDDASDAELILVNTCGFIGEAKKESIDAIFEMARQKETGRCKKLVVTGCLAQRHPEELADQIPEIDHLLGSSDMMKLGKVLEGDADRILVGTPADWLTSAAAPRVLSTRPGSAYVKIAEGCNRTCSFCVIPELRGKQRSRAIDDVVREVEALVSRGVKEINLVSQDTVAYGRDRPERPVLSDLVRAVAEVPGLVWARLFYLYPETLTDELLELLASHPRVLPYVDMPLQHAADGMLRRMRRGHGGARLRKVVSTLRDRVPNLVFRSAFIVGHPGETQEEFEELCEFIRWAEFDRVGFFRYSDEESSRSFTFEGKVPARTAQSRYRKLTTIQRAILDKKNKAMIGRDVDVLVEGMSDEHEFVMMGRHGGQAPEIDGQVYLSGGECTAGELRRVTITQASDCDLVGELHEVDASSDAAASTESTPRAPRRANVRSPKRLPVVR
ncbi:MAG: 30S ribosomal protein S12 methylthiotransferase RimO [Polyangiaceae bacterium]|nr:30S ribosomal protein S12 methylthiotransferase RimO [Polyangiaceae bacterium]